MKNIILNKQQKKELVIKLLKENKTYREIQEIGHVSPNFITKIKKEEFGETSVESENFKKTRRSKMSQAIDLFYKGKKPYEIILELDIDVDEIKKAQVDYLQLLNLDDLSQIVQDNNTNLLKEFNYLFAIFKELKIDTIEKVKEIKELVETYPNLQYEILCLKKEIYDLKRQKKSHKQVLNDIKYEISLANVSKNEIESQIKNKKIKLRNLESLEKMQSPGAYNNFKELIEPIIKNEYWYKTTILPLMIVSVLEIIRNEPMGKTMFLDFYNNNPVSLYNNNKETTI